MPHGSLSFVQFLIDTIYATSLNLSNMSVPIICFLLILREMNGRVTQSNMDIIGIL